MSDFDRQIFRTLEKLRITVGYSHADWADALGLSKPQYASSYLSQKSVHLNNIQNLEPVINASVETIVSGQIDWNAVEAHKSGNHSYLPERYMTAAFSRKRTAVTMLNFSDRILGPHFTATLLRNLQIHRSALANPDEFVNVQLGNDILTYIKSYNVGAGFIVGIGKNSTRTNRSSLLGKELSKEKSITRIYERMITELIHLYEKNCSYRLLSLDDNSCVIESKDNPDVAEALKVHHIGSAEICLYKQGILTAMPEYIECPSAVVQETHCVHHGDSSCRFAVDFSKSQHLMATAV
jgi:predicted hydrocarbon binding protein/predicted transcriptional regulator